MSNIIKLALVLIAGAIVGYIVANIMLFLEEKQRENEIYNTEHSLLCEKARSGGTCPMNCDKCAWAVHMEKGRKE